MSDPFQSDSFSTSQGNSTGSPAPQIVNTGSPLPVWISRRLLRPGETVTWVRGPRHNPAWEVYITHPVLFVAAVAVGILVAAMGLLSDEKEIRVAFVLAGCAIPLASIFVLGFSAGYFTRLVVTNFRVAIVQGIELCWDCGIDFLPPSLVRYDRRYGEKARAAVNLDALQTALGGSSTQFVEAKTILAFKRQIDRDKRRERGRDDDDKTLPDG